MYKLDVPLPEHSGQHVIRNTWQRSDSQEAFYTCADVRFEGSDVTPPTQWPLVLARKTHATAAQARVGILRDGVGSAWRNAWIPY